MNTLFLADWCEVAFVHFRVDADRLQRIVPFELDRFEGAAHVSLVAFTQKRLRPALGGRIAELLSAPVANHEFLNLRTYVRHGKERAIYFLAEWIPNRLAAFLGPRLYGLPYRLGQLSYSPSHRIVRAVDASVEISGEIDSEPRTAVEGTLEHFLVERYIAFTHRRGVSRRFEIQHAPWKLQQMSIKECDVRLDFMELSKPVCAQYSIGVRDVRISAPMIVTSQASRARRSRCRLHRSGNAGCP